MGRRFAVTLRGIFLAIATLSLSACAQFEIADRSLEYNLAIEDASNRMLLLNVVRASKRYPMHFTAITDVNMSSPVSGSLGFNIPFGGDAKNAFTITPSASASSGIKTSLGVLNKKEFFRGITTPIKGETFHFYLLQGWPRELLFYMFIRQIDLKSEQTRDDIIGASDKRCRDNTDALCNPVSLEKTFGGSCETRIKEYDDDNEPYTNQPGNLCKFMRFQDLIRRLRILDFDVVQKGGTKDVIEKVVTTVSEGPQGKTKVTKTEIAKKGFVTYSLSYKADLVTFEPDIQLKLSGIDFSEKIMFSRVPGGARLSAGTDKGGGRWTLKSEKLEELKKDNKGLRVIQPRYSAKDFQLAYEGKDKNDKPVKGWIEMTRPYVITLAKDFYPKFADSEDVTFTGLAAGTRLSAGTDEGGGSWSLNVNELKDLKIIVPHAPDGSFTFIVSGKDDRGDVFSSTFDMKKHVPGSIEYVPGQSDMKVQETESLVELSAIQGGPPAAETVRPVPVAPLPEVFLRSPEAMIFYLGELLEVQNRPLKKVESVTEDTPLRDIAYTPKITLGSGPKRIEVNLFRVIKGAISGAAAVSVSHEGDTYHIPRVKEERGRSMHVLSLVSQIFALHRSSQELPSTSTIRVISD